MNKRFTLSTQVVVLAVLCAGVGLAVAYFGAVKAGRAIMLRSVSAHMRGRSAQVLDTVRHDISGHLSEVSIWASSAAMQESLENNDPKFAEDYFLRTVPAKRFALVALLKADTKVLAAAQPDKKARVMEIAESLHGIAMPLPPNPKTVRLAITPSVTAFQGNNYTRLILVAPIIDFAGDVVGHVAAVLSRGGLQRILSEGVASEPGGQVFPVLFDDEGAVLISDRPDLEQRAVNLPRVDVEAASDHEVFGQTVLGSDQEYLAFVASRPRAESPRFSIATFSPTNVVMGPVVRFERITLWLFLAVLAMLGSAMVLVMKHSTAPLVEMMGYLKAVSEGDYTVRLPAQRATDLDAIATAFNAMVVELEFARKAIHKTVAMRQEVEIANRIHTSMLQQNINIKDFDIKAFSMSAFEVGGDYYNVVNTGEKFWATLGDVTGHGINAGLIRVMALTATSSTIRSNPDIAPPALMSHVNDELYENIRNRMKSTDHLTAIFLRHLGDGKFVGAGAHTPVFIMRRNGDVEEIVPKGPYCGVSPEIPTIDPFELQLQPGESLVLMTDGLLESANAENEAFGDDRVIEALEKSPRDKGSEGILDFLISKVAQHANTQREDITAMVITRKQFVRES